MFKYGTTNEVLDNGILTTNFDNGTTSFTPNPDPLGGGQCRDLFQKDGLHILVILIQMKQLLLKILAVLVLMMRGKTLQIVMRAMKLLLQW